MKVTTEHYMELIQSIEVLEEANVEWEKEYNILLTAFETYVTKEEKQKVKSKTIGFR